jgi:glycosyltransferase involved in cell wall biosynthesis
MKKVLFIMHYSPPVYGSNVVGSMIRNSLYLNSLMNSKYIKIESSMDISKIRKFSFSKVFQSFKLFWIVLYDLITFRPDIIYFTPSVKGAAFYRDFFVTVLPKIYCRLFKKNILFHYHTQGVKKFTNKSRFHHSIVKCFFRNVNLVLLSRFLINDIEEIKTHKRVFFLPNGIQNDLVEDDLKSIIDKRALDKNINILFVSNLKVLKGVIDAYESFKSLYLDCKYSNIHLYIVGGFTEPAIVKALNEDIKKNALEEVVHITGPKYDNEKFEYFKKAHIFLFPSHYEAFGLVNIEAMQYALPVISTKEGGIQEVVDDKVTGFLVEKTQVDQIIDRLKELIANRELQVEMGKAGRKRFLEMFVINKFEENLMNILKSV